MGNKVGLTQPDFLFVDRKIEKKKRKRDKGRARRALYIS
jgi:hypothetical protein